MNAHFNWHFDDVLKFELVLYNPLCIPLPITFIEIFQSKKKFSLVPLDTEYIGYLAPKTKKNLQMRFRANWNNRPQKICLEIGSNFAKSKYTNP